VQRCRQRHWEILVRDGDVAPVFYRGAQYGPMESLRRDAHGGEDGQNNMVELQNPASRGKIPTRNTNTFNLHYPRLLRLDAMLCTTNN